MGSERIKCWGMESVSSARSPGDKPLWHQLLSLTISLVRQLGNSYSGYDSNWCQRVLSTGHLADSFPKSGNDSRDGGDYTNLTATRFGSVHKIPPCLQAAP